MFVLWLVNLFFLKRHLIDAARAKLTHDAILAITSSNTTNETSDLDMVPKHGGPCYPDAAWNKIEYTKCMSNVYKCRTVDDLDDAPPDAEYFCYFPKGSRDLWLTCKDHSECKSGYCDQVCKTKAAQWGQTCTTEQASPGCVQGHGLTCRPVTSLMSPHMRCLKPENSGKEGGDCFDDSECGEISETTAEGPKNFQGACKVEPTRYLDQKAIGTLTGRRVQVVNAPRGNSLQGAPVFLKSYNGGKWIVEKDVVKYGWFEQRSQATGGDVPETGEVVTSALRPDFPEMLEAVQGKCRKGKELY